MPLVALVSVSLVLISVVLVTLIVARRESTPNQKSPGAATSVPTTVELDGNLTCLPHKDSSSNYPQTLQCEIGLHTDDDSYYRLTNLDQSDASTSHTKRVHVEGSASQPAADEPYDIAGTISVTLFAVY